MLNIRKLRVFLCHASDDKPRIRSLYKKLSSEAWIDTWLDEEKLLPGQKWQIEIPKALLAADVILVCLSTKSVSKEGYVQRELKYALDAALEKPDETIFIIPLRFDDCSIPEKIKELQWLNFFSDEDEKAYERLKRSLVIRATSLGISIKTVPEPVLEKESASAARNNLEELNAFGFALHQIGNVFLDGRDDVAHIVARIDSDPLPTDEDAPSYQAICGKWGFGYSMGDIPMATFIARSSEDAPPGVNRCPICFSNVPSANSKNN